MEVLYQKAINLGNLEGINKFTEYGSFVFSSHTK